MNRNDWARFYDEFVRAPDIESSDHSWRLIACIVVALDGGDEDSAEAVLGMIARFQKRRPWIRDLVEEIRATLAAPPRGVVQ